MMNMQKTTTAATCLMAVLLMAASTAKMSGATALQGRFSVRPLTPEELKNPSLVGKQGANGLATVGIGQPVYLDVLINSAITPSEITSVFWTLAAKPTGSAVDLAPSPLGTNIPIYDIKDRATSRVVARMMLRPDLVGQYTIGCAIQTTGSGSTNLTQVVTAGTYLGNESCGYCHGGGPLAPDKYESWLETKHASMFTRHIDGQDGGYSRSSCITCHTVGYDANTNAVNGGFDDVAKKVGWTFPTVLTNGNWAAMPHELQVVANIGCENCHGAGSEHAVAALLQGPDAAKKRISKTFGVGDCAQCHDSMTHHFRPAEWANSRHAVAVEETEAGCARCHTGPGFVNYVDGAPAVATEYEVFTCTACHDPHDATNPHQLRKTSPVTLMDNKTTITEGGNGLLCMNCHMSRRDATNYVETATLNNRFGPHHGPQADMLAGANAITYGKTVPSSAHREVVEGACVTCHMQEAETSPAFTHAGGHTFAMKWETATNTIELTEACVQCHGEIEEFDFKRQDYDGNGIVEGVQTEVKGLLSQLALMLPPVGVPKPNHSPTNIAINSTWTRQQGRAGYNYLFVVEDGSFGIHNLSYAVGLLKASIADLSGDSNKDGIADWWQQQYFGANWATDPNASRNASPAGDNIPNWLKYTLGLDPHVAGVVVPDGVVWANGSTIGGGTNTIHIYTAAEVAFDTQLNTTYQIQAASAVSGGWQNIGAPIPGTGAAVSYVTPTRKNVQQFYRVMHTP
jgi:hypothetical protein